MSKFDPNDHLIILQGKQYLEVKWRLVWFREEHPDGIILTEILEHNPADRWAVIKATVTIPGGGVATGMVIQSPTGVAKDYIANGETSAIGRALAALGYGTQHAIELDQGDQVVDAPVDRTPAAARPTTAALSGKHEPTPASTPAKPPRPTGLTPSAPAIDAFWKGVTDLGWQDDAVTQACRDLYPYADRVTDLIIPHFKEFAGLLRDGRLTQDARGHYAAIEPKTA